MKLFINRVGIIEFEGIWNGLYKNECNINMKVIIGKICCEVLIRYGSWGFFL